MIIVSKKEQVDFLQEIIEESVYTKNIGTAYLLLFNFLLESDIKNFPWAIAKKEDLDPYALYILNNREKYNLNTDISEEDILTISIIDIIPEKITNLVASQINGKNFTLQYEYASLIYFNFLLDNIKLIINDNMEYQHNIESFNKFIDEAEQTLTQIPLEDFEIMKDFERSGTKRVFMNNNKETVSSVVEEKLFLNIDENIKKEILDSSLQDFNKTNEE